MAKTSKTFLGYLSSLFPKTYPTHLHVDWAQLCCRHDSKQGEPHQRNHASYRQGKGFCHPIDSHNAHNVGTFRLLVNQKMFY